MNFNILSAAILASACAFSAMAQTRQQSFSASDTIRQLASVEVVEQAAKAPVALLPLDVRVVTGEELEESRQANVLPVLQQRIPGMFVTERGLAGYGVSGGSAGSVSIRGVGGGNKVLFLIDGQPQWAGVFGHSLPDTYVTNDVERAEVVSGPSSLLYGSGAMGGSVNLITRHATEDGFSGAASAMGGSYGSQQYSVRGEGRYKGFGVSAAASYESTDGSRRGMGYWLANQYLSLSYRFSRHWEAGANAMVTETKADNAGSVYRAKPLGMWTRMLRTTASVYVKNSYEVTSGGVQAYYNWGKHKIDDGLDRTGKPRNYHFNSRDFNMGLTLYQTVRPWEGNNLSLGVDFKHWGGEAYNAPKEGDTSNRSMIVDAHVNEIAGYAMMQQGFLSDMINVNAGVRLEHSSQFGNQWVPQAGFIFRPLTDSRMKFSYGKGFRSPNVRELYMYGPRNASLEPERMYNLEVELRQWLLNRRLCMGLAFYYINGDNLIQQVATPQGSQLNVNTGRFINKGVEFDADYRISGQWSVNANYAYLHTDARIVAAPRHKLFAQAEFKPGRWEFAADFTGIWHLLTEESTENYGLLGARASYTFSLRGCDLTLVAKGENLTAARYQINYGFPMPRATVMAGASVRF